MRSSSGAPLVERPREPALFLLADELEPEPLVVIAYPGKIALAVEAHELAPASCRLVEDPVDDPLAEPLARKGPPDRELVQVHGVRWARAPEERVVEEQRERRRSFVADVDDVQLTPADAIVQLVPRKRDAPLVAPLRLHVCGRLVEDRRDRRDVGGSCSPDVHAVTGRASRPRTNRTGIPARSPRGRAAWSPRPRRMPSRARAASSAAGGSS